MDYSTLILSNIGDTINALTNSTVIIDCEATGFPLPSITWTKEDVNLTTGEGRIISNNGSLILEQVTKKDAGTYTCKALNTRGSDSQTSQLNVMGKYSIKIIDLRNKIVT